jgi:integrase
VSIEKLPSRRYRAVVRHGGAKRASEAVDTVAEAKMLEARLKLSMGGSATPRERHSVGEVVSGYIADGSGRLSPGTLDFYRKGLAALPDAFRNRGVAEVTPLVLDSVYVELRDEGASEHKVQKVHRLLSAAFNRAVRYGWLLGNPCLQATKPKVDTDEIEPPPPEWVRKLIADAESVNEDLAVCLRLAAATGARRGEVVAIKWYDFSGSRLTIRRSLVESEGQLFERRTKTGSKGHRTIVVDAETMRAIDALRARQRAIAEEHELPDPVYVFSFDAGVTPWRPDYVSLAYGRLSKREYRLHDLRHYHATQLLAAGVPVTTVSKRLGHTSAAVTLNTYGHWLPEQDRDAADIIGRLLDQPIHAQLASVSASARSTAATENTHRPAPGMIGRTGDEPFRTARLSDSGWMPQR